MKLFHSIIIIYLLGIGISAKSQQYYDFGFSRDNSIAVNDSLGNPLPIPWVGGLDAVHFQEFDLNFDNYMDLVVFDVHGDRLLTFINNGSTTFFPYIYDPKYESAFPEILSWMQTLDYDNDGDMDLFFYSTYSAGISVYQNISSNNKIKFKLITNAIYYNVPNWPSTNLFVSQVDYPAIVDVDNDGDIDVLTFSVIGKYVYYFKNFSMEMYGIPDSLEFKLVDRCWGKFFENDSTNAVVLNHQCNKKVASKSIGGNGIKHTGSTLLVIDLNNDTLKDLILGDVDYFTLNAMINGGTLDSAHMISQDTTYPSNNQMVDVITFPLAKYIDVNNDNIKDLIVSPFDASYYKTNGNNSVWFYENLGSNSLPNFNLVKKNFMQDKMIDVSDGANPSLVDVDGDGLLDLIISNYGHMDSSYLDTNIDLHTFKTSHLAYYKNIGSTGNPKYQYMDGDWAGLSSLKRLGLRATFGDIDNDGDNDMLVGSNNGKIIYYENTAGNGQMMSFASPDTNYQNISVGLDNFSTPQLIDINNDSLLDLVIGKKSNHLRTISNLDSLVGYISYYKNTGTPTQPIFTLETDSMGNIDPKSYLTYYDAFSSPFFFRDSTDSLKLFVGSASGLTFYYRDIEDNIYGTFGIDSNLTYTDVYETLYSVFSYENTDKNLVPLNVGLRSAPLVHDFNNDGYPDIMIGGFAGGLNYFKGIPAPGVGIKKPNKITAPNITLYPNPAEDYVILAIDKDLQALDITIYDMTGRSIYSKRRVVNEKIKINTSNLNQGIYFISVNSNSYSGQKFHQTLKLIVL